jgi:hypothetical protein
VDGEIGRFTFKTSDAKGENQKPVFEGIQMFPAGKGRQWYPTCGFKTIALIYGAVQRSYRQTITVLNFNRRQEVDWNPTRTPKPNRFHHWQLDLEANQLSSWP